MPFLARGFLLETKQDAEVWNKKGKCRAAPFRGGAEAWDHPPGPPPRAPLGQGSSPVRLAGRALTENLL